jgi:hypothetical protein
LGYVPLSISESFSKGISLLYFVKQANEHGNMFVDLIFV